MGHRLGPVIPLAVPGVIGPDFGDAPTALNVWEVVFSPPAAPDGTKFLILHFTGVTLTGGDRVEVELGYDLDVFTAGSGSEFWTRPVAGNSVTVCYVDDGVGGAEGQATLDKYGRGEGLLDDGGPGDNANGDMFLLDSPFQDPPYANPSGLCEGRSWENVACLPDGIMQTTARSVGMIIAASSGAHPGTGCRPGEDECLASCSAALIGPDLILTAGHCFATDEEAAPASITFDFVTNCDGTRPAGYNPVCHKLTHVVRSGFGGQQDDARGFGAVRDGRRRCARSRRHDNHRRRAPHGAGAISIPHLTPTPRTAGHHRTSCRSSSPAPRPAASLGLPDARPQTASSYHRTAPRWTTAGAWPNCCLARRRTPRCR